jgi:hypothetical protein
MVPKKYFLIVIKRFPPDLVGLRKYYRGIRLYIIILLPLYFYSLIMFIVHIGDLFLGAGSTQQRPVPGVSPSTAAAVAAAAASAVSGRESSKSSVPIDYSRYVRKFSNAAECGNNHCRDLNYR